MATQCFLRSTATTSNRFSTGTNNTNLAGVASAWTNVGLDTSRGTGISAGTATSTVAGPTAGIEQLVSTAPAVFISPPLDAAVTISGTITFNVWGAESSNSANVGAQCVIERVGPTGTIISTVVNSEKGTELPLTTRAAQNWTATPTSTSFAKGDRIRVRVAGNDIGTMASGFTFNFTYSGTSAAADGDSYVTFTETIGFLTTDPTTSTLYPTTTASDVDPGGGTVDTFEAWTARGSGSTTAVTNTTAGWTAPIQVTTAAGGNAIEWFSKALGAFTLAAPVLVNVRVKHSAASTADVRAELAVTANDGTSPTVWGANNGKLTLTTSDAAGTFYLSGPDTSVTSGQRLRLRLYIDDSPGAAMTTAQTITMTYAGVSAAAAGDTYFAFGQAVSEYVAPLPDVVMAPPRPA